MKGFFWKELRENMLWGVLALVLFSGIFGYPVWDIIQRYAGAYLEPRMLSTISDNLVVYASLFGLILGFLQVLPELRQDRWAFLVHRPATRSQIFWGKAVPGFLLYFGAIAIPYHLAVWWLVHHVGFLDPFSWRMTRGARCDILSGSLFYFAALLTAIRPARWYASRGLPLLAAGLTVLALYIIPYYALTVPATLLCIVLFATAVKGSFLTDGHYTGQPKRARCALGVVLYCGILVVGIALVNVTIVFSQVVAEKLRIKTTEDAAALAAVGEVHPGYYYAVNQAGQIILVRTDRGHDTWFLMQGTNRMQTGPQIATDKKSTLQGARLYLGKEVYSWQWWHFRQAEVELHLNEGSYDSIWVYSRTERRLIEYNRERTRIMGYAGPAGFYAPGAKSNFSSGAYFPGEILNNAMSYGQSENVFGVLLSFSDRAYWANFRNRSVTELVAAQEHLHVQQATTWWMTKHENKYIQDKSKPVTVLTNKDIRLFRIDGSPIFKTPLDSAVSTNKQIQVAALPGLKRFFIIYHPIITLSSDTALPVYVTELGSDGTVLARHILPPLPRFQSQPPPPERFTFNHAVYAFTMPPSAVPVLVWITSQTTGADSAGAYLREFMQSNTRFVGWWGGVQLLAIIFSVLSVLAITRRCAFFRYGSIAWTIGTILLGPSAVLLLLALREWPAREKCPACKRKSVVDRELCEHCGARFEQPRQTGNEIFEKQRVPAEAC